MKKKAYNAIKGTLWLWTMYPLKLTFFAKPTHSKLVFAPLATQDTCFQTANASWARTCTLPSVNSQTLKENASNATIAITYLKTHVPQSPFCVTVTTKQQKNLSPVHLDTFSRTNNAFTLL